MMPILQASTFEELQSKLIELNKPVPAHPRLRVNEDVETYCLVSLLSSISWKADSFPLSILRRERPDFLLQLNGKEVGLEHTEAIHINMAKERSIRADGIGPNVYSPTPTWYDDAPLSSGEITERIVADRDGDGWAGDSVERNWADAMKNFIAKKTASATKTGYELYKYNRLMIYDNWAPAGLRLSNAVELLESHLRIDGQWTVFDRVYVVSEASVVELSESSVRFYRCSRMALVDPGEFEDDPEFGDNLEPEDES